jgi:hypothetical protein
MKRKIQIGVLFLFMITLISLTSCVDLRTDYDSIEPTYTITFAYEDNTVIKKVTTKVGVSIQKKDIPTVANRTGYTYTWQTNSKDDTTSVQDFTTIQKDMTVYLVYKQVQE